jgi:hypothetical protein
MRAPGGLGTRVQVWLACSVSYSAFMAAYQFSSLRADWTERGIGESVPEATKAYLGLGF